MYFYDVYSLSSMAGVSENLLKIINIDRIFRIMYKGVYQKAKKEETMPKYNGVDQQDLVQSIEDAMDYILKLEFVPDVRSALDDWIDGRRLAVIKQSSSDEELSRNMTLMGADTLFHKFERLMLSARFNDVTSATQKTIRTLEKWKAFSPKFYK